jgi:hypothetical protein
MVLCVYLIYVKTRPAPCGMYAYRGWIVSGVLMWEGESNLCQGEMNVVLVCPCQCRRWKPGTTGRCTDGRLAERHEQQQLKRTRNGTLTFPLF